MLYDEFDDSKNVLTKFDIDRSSSTKIRQVFLGKGICSSFEIVQIGQCSRYTFTDIVVDWVIKSQHWSTTHNLADLFSFRVK